MEPPESVTLLIAAARTRLKQVVGQRVRHHGLSPTQFWVLVALAEVPSPSLCDLGKRLRIDAPTSSRVAAALVARGLVQVEGDARDKRRSRLRLTVAGTALTAELLPIAHDVRAKAVAGFAPDEKERLHALLARVVANLEDGGAADCAEEEPAARR